MTIATGGGGKGAAAAARRRRVRARRLARLVRPRPAVQGWSRRRAACPPTWLLLVPEPNHNGDCIPVISTSPLYRGRRATRSSPSPPTAADTLKKAKAKAAESDDDDDDASPKKGGKQKSIEGRSCRRSTSSMGDQGARREGADVGATTSRSPCRPRRRRVRAPTRRRCAPSTMPASTAKMLVESATSTELGHMGAQEKTKG